MREKIRKLKPASAAGPDGIGPRLLQETIDFAAPALTSIFRASVEEGVVPGDWREANVTPIFKKGAKSNPSNYRPVSLTSVPGKLLESLIKDELMDHFKKNRVIFPSQHGFMPNKSCTSNLLEFFDLVTKIVDGGEPFDAVFLDFAKAFDKVPISPLLAKLKGLGVSGQLLAWIEAWLTNRRQQVVLNGSCSSWAEVDSGVPQGSILGPVLFLVFINDLDLQLAMVDICRKFADDTKLGQRAATTEQRQLLQQALDQLAKWADTWGMAFNLDKCKVMHIGKNNLRQPYYMSGRCLNTTEEERDVGVMINSSLRPGSQCAKAAKTAGAVLGQITRAFHYRDRQVFVQLYKQYVRPHLEFAGPAWSPWTGADIEVLERVQRKAVGMVTGLTARTYEEKLGELGLTTLEERRHQQDILQVFKIVRGFDDVDVSQMFEMTGETVPGRMTRQTADPHNIRVQRCRLDVRKYFFSHRVVEPWNRLPPSLKGARSVHGFKSAYAKYRVDRVRPV